MFAVGIGTAQGIDLLLFWIELYLYIVVIGKEARSTVYMNYRKKLIFIYSVFVHALSMHRKM